MSHKAFFYKLEGFVRSEIKYDLVINIINPLTHEGHFYGSTLNAYYGKSNSASNIIVVQSPRLRIDLNFYII